MVQRSELVTIDKILSGYILRAASEYNVDAIAGLEPWMLPEEMARRIWAVAGGGVRGYVLASCILKKAADMMDCDGLDGITPKLLKVMEVLEL